jgi:LysM repeat protein/ABC-type branched-subunit amino acid transport system substrate-binding protein
MKTRISRFTIVFTFLFALTVIQAMAQVKVSSETVVIGGKKYLLHTVEKGQTLYSISQSYGVSQTEIVDENPSVKDGLSIGEILRIPVDRMQKSESRKEKRRRRHKTRDKQHVLPPSADFFFHPVKPQETAYSISRQYGVDVQTIYQYNPEAKKELLVGEVLRVPRHKQVSTGTTQPAQANANYIYHKVEKGETLYSISKQYNRKISEIVNANPGAAQSLETGSILRIPKMASTEPTQLVPTALGQYFTYRVETGDTYFSLKQRFGISQDELVKLNPQLYDGLNAGLVVRIPEKQVASTKIVPINKNLFQYHTVTKGETLYGLSHQYNVKISQLKELNPVLKLRGPVAGEQLLIPKPGVPEELKENLTDEIKANASVQTRAYEVESNPAAPKAECMGMGWTGNEPIKIGLFLPLYLEANDTVNYIRMTPDEIQKQIAEQKAAGIDDPVVDSVKVRENKIIYQPSVNFLDFYEGVLLALDTLKQQGIKTELYVYDTNQDTSVIRQLVQRPEFLSLNLIIGPVYPKCQKLVSQLSAKNRILMVSPLSANGGWLASNPYYFQINPDKMYRLKATADYLGDDFFNKNFIVMKMGNNAHLDESQMVDWVRNKFFSTGYYDQTPSVLFHEFDFREGGYYGLIHLLDPNKENVVIVPMTSEADVNVAVTNLNTAAKKYSITLVGLSEFSRYRSIETDYLHNLKLHYLAPYYIDYRDKGVVRFIQRYRNDFYDEPNQFSFQGYDITNYFVNAIRKFGTNFAQCLPYLNVHLLQGDYNFQKVSDFGGFMNHTLYIMKYTRGYQVKAVGKVGDLPLLLSGQPEEMQPDSTNQQNNVITFPGNRN